jgi:hypothetical protein
VGDIPLGIWQQHASLELENEAEQSGVNVSHVSGIVKSRYFLRNAVQKHVGVSHCSIIANMVKTQVVNASYGIDLAFAIEQHHQ